jgi:hypothetical protein
MTSYCKPETDERAASAESPEPEFRAEAVECIGLDPGELGLAVE